MGRIATKKSNRNAFKFGGTTLTWIEIIAAFIAGGGIQYILNWLTARKNSDRDDFTKIVETWQLDNERLRHENDRLESELNKIRTELADLRAKVILMESAHSDAPLPMWLKDSKGIMLSVNKAYEDAFLIPIGKTASEYIGNTDYSVWPPKIAAEYQKNDAEVLSNGLPWRGVEPVLQSDGTTTDWYILKYVRYAGTIKLGVAGIAIPMRWN